MKLKRKSFVTYFTEHGRTLFEKKVVGVKSRDLQRAIKKAPKKAVALCFHDVVSAKVDIEGESGPVLLESGEVNQSPRYFFGARVITVNEIRSLPEDTEDFCAMLEAKGLQAIATRVGKVVTLHENDVLVAEAA